MQIMKRQRERFETNIDNLEINRLICIYNHSSWFTHTFNLQQLAKLKSLLILLLLVRIFPFHLKWRSSTIWRLRHYSKWNWTIRTRSRRMRSDFSLVKSQTLRDILQETRGKISWDVRTAELKVKAEQSKSVFSFILYFLAYTSTSAHTETYLQPRW